MDTQISITTPTDFNFDYTVNSHGWERLEPFSIERENRMLTRIERLPSQLSRLEITYSDTIDVTLHSDDRLTKADKAYVNEFIAYCFAFNWDMSGRQTGTGYRAKYIRSLAEAISSGFDPESLRNPALSYEEISDRVRALHGFGEYSASYVLKLLGRFERISIDTVMRRYFKQIAGQQTATDDDINAYYERFGKCKGLVAWWEVSRRADAKGELSF